MKTVEMMEALSSIALFHGLTDHQLRRITDHLHEQTYPAGTKIIEQGKVGFGLFMIVSGAAEVVFEGGTGGKVVNMLGPKDFFGEISLLDDGPRTASVVATSATTCLILNRIDFISLMMQDAAMGVQIATELAKRIRKLLESMGGQ
ncbi:MAG: cyclic nucleotide-binding domain-containing protein [Anaerolineae bacterium]|nr:cyclic nucleotide-binding domain-containing protein [Anaerolineae bacterium]